MSCICLSACLLASLHIPTPYIVKTILCCWRMLLVAVTISLPCEEARSLLTTRLSRVIPCKCNKCLEAQRPSSHWRKQSIALNQPNPGVYKTTSSPILCLRSHCYNNAGALTAATKELIHSGFWWVIAFWQARAADKEEDRAHVTGSGWCHQ